jgi:hypothetical protein
MKNTKIQVRPLRVYLRPKSAAESGFRARAVMPEARAPGLPSTPAHDLISHGGKTIADLQFANYYVGGAGAWNNNDIQSIDQALAAAMSDQHLNNVMAQYYSGGHLSSKFLGSETLAGPPPQTVSQGDVENLVRTLYRAGNFSQYDLANTVVNFMLPSGTILNTDPTPTSSAITATTEASRRLAAAAERPSPIPHEEEDSTQGLGGYHGSVHIDATTIAYYAVGVYSEKRPDGTVNGIPVFDQSWKNVVATFYHELNEARTDSDVEDAIRAGNDPSAVKFLGWVSKQGEECGDFPVFEANPLTKVFQEVQVTDGSRTVPVQFEYSNAVHGPEGPIAQPHPVASSHGRKAKTAKAK